MSEEQKHQPEPAESSNPEAAEAGAPEQPAATPSQQLPDLLGYARVALPALWLAAVIAAGVVSGIELSFLVLASGVLVLVITLMWLSVQSLTGGAALGFEEALGMGAPSKVEEQKRAVLRALKDLEYERGVGKISPEDYAELSAKYRAEAKLLIQSVDETLAPARKEVERALERRLAQAGIALAEPPAEAPEQPSLQSSQDTADEPAADAAASADDAAPAAAGDSDGGSDALAADPEQPAQARAEAKS